MRARVTLKQLSAIRCVTFVIISSLNVQSSFLVPLSALASSAETNQAAAIEKLRRQRKYEQALDLVNQAIKLHPHDWQLLRSRGDILLCLNRAPKAISDYNQAYKTKPDMPDMGDFFASRGTAYRITDNFDAALADLNRSLRIRPNHPRALANRAQTNIESGHWEKAAPDILLAEKQPDLTADDACDLAWACNRLSNPQQTLKLADIAIRLEPELARAHRCKATALRKLFKPKSALAEIETALRLGDRDYFTYYLRACIFKEMFNYDQALIDLEKSIKAAPDEVLPYELRAVIYKQIGEDPKKIAEDLTRVVKAKPWDIDALRHRSEAYFDSLQYDLALKDLNKVLQVDKKSALCHQRRAEIYLLTGKPSLAIPDLTEAIALDPHQPRHLILRGKAYAMLKQYKTAINDYSASIKLVPYIGEAYRQRAKAYRLSGNAALAAKDEQLAKRMDTEFFDGALFRSDRRKFH